MTLRISLLITLFCALTAQGAVYTAPTTSSDIIGKTFTATTQSRDSSTTIRNRYEITYNSLLEANSRINFNRLSSGQEIIIPAEYILPPYRKGIVVNIPELRLYYFTPDGKHIVTFPVGLGRLGWRTPVISTRIINKKAGPTWYVPDSIRNYTLAKTGQMLPDFIEPGPNNPLGQYALYLEKRGYLIHGTNAPDSVGTFASSGCIRMSDEGIETLFKLVAVGTPVYIINHNNKFGWSDETLFLEAHHKLDDLKAKDSPLNITSPQEALQFALTKHTAAVNWTEVNRLTSNPTGIPFPIGQIAD